MKISGKLVLAYLFFNFLYINVIFSQDTDSRKRYRYKSMCITIEESKDIEEKGGFFPECALDTFPYISKPSLSEKYLKNKNFLLILNGLEKPDYYNYWYDFENITIRRLSFFSLKRMGASPIHLISKGLYITIQVDVEGKCQGLYIYGKELSDAERIAKGKLFAILNDSKWNPGYSKGEKVDSKFSFLFEIND